MTAPRLARFVSRAGWIACLGTIALSLAAPGVARLPAVQWLPWLIGLFVLGIPHGAFDHKVGEALGRVEGDRSARVAGVGFYAAYLAAAVGVIGLWMVSPLAASAGFLAVAAAHFGQGDVYWSREFGLAERSGSVGYRASLLLARSTLPIALPLLAFPGEFAGAADLLASRLFGRASWAVPLWAIGVGLGVVAAVVLVQIGWAALLAWGGDQTTRRAAACDVVETLLLAVTFAVAPPVLALGVYFNAWHSLRHVGRLMMIAGSTRELVASGRLVSAFAAFQRGAIPMTCGALAMVAVLGLLLGRSVASVVDIGLLALVGLSALTLPHVLVVAWMDARQGVWSARPGRG